MDKVVIPYIQRVLQALPTAQALTHLPHVPRPPLFHLNKKHEEDDEGGRERCL